MWTVEKVRYEMQDTGFQIRALLSGIVYKCMKFDFGWTKAFATKQICFVHNAFMNTIIVAFTDLKPNFSLDINLFRRLSYCVFFCYSS